MTWREGKGGYGDKFRAREGDEGKDGGVFQDVEERQSVRGVLSKCSV